MSLGNDWVGSYVNGRRRRESWDGSDEAEGAS